VILVQILRHVLELVEITKLTLFVIHDDLFFFFDCLNNLLHLVIKVVMHTLDIISFSFSVKKFQKLSFFKLQVDGGSTLGHAAWWVGAKAEEISEDIRGSGFLGGSSLSVSTSSW
jgi:hypothetical protein